VFEALDIGSTAGLRPVPLRDPRFVIDVNLGRLARAVDPPMRPRFQPLRGVRTDLLARVASSKVRQTSLKDSATSSDQPLER
jgi:hypothetical protein